MDQSEIVPKAFTATRMMRRTSRYRPNIPLGNGLGLKNRQATIAGRRNVRMFNES